MSSEQGIIDGALDNVAKENNLATICANYGKLLMLYYKDFYDGNVPLHTMKRRQLEATQLFVNELQKILLINNDKYMERKS